MNYDNKRFANDLFREIAEEEIKRTTSCDGMKIEFYISKGETIPTDLRLKVDGNQIEYERVKNGFLFKTLIDDEEEALEIVSEIVKQIKREHDEPEHGISWRTVSLSVVPQEDRYKIGTWVRWEYRVRDSY